MCVRRVVSADIYVQWCWLLLCFVIMCLFYFMFKFILPNCVLELVGLNEGWS